MSTHAGHLLCLELGPVGPKRGADPTGRGHLFLALQLSMQRDVGPQCSGIPAVAPWCVVRGSGATAWLYDFVNFVFFSALADLFGCAAGVGQYFSLCSSLQPSSSHSDLLVILRASSWAHLGQHRLSDDVRLSCQFVPLKLALSLGNSVRTRCRRSLVASLLLRRSTANWRRTNISSRML